MSLDTVELIIATEEKFGIEIPDLEAENISTVQGLADTVAQKLPLKKSNRCLSQATFYRIRQGLEMLGYDAEAIVPAAQIDNLLDTPHLGIALKSLEEETGLTMPKLKPRNPNKPVDEYVWFFGLKVYRRRPLPPTDYSLRKLTDWVVSLNAHQLIDINNLAGKYEIERITCQLVDELLGVHVQEVELYHAFTNDLGAD